MCTLTDAAAKHFDGRSDKTLTHDKVLSALRLCDGHHLFGHLDLASTVLYGTMMHKVEWHQGGK
jgi:hypothetical protein